jgi:hypothetical protein
MIPAISVVTPPRNDAVWLGLSQTSGPQDFADFRFLILDDGSNDGNAAMLPGSRLMTAASVSSGRRPHQLDVHNRKARTKLGRAYPQQYAFPNAETK